MEKAGGPEPIMSRSGAISGGQDQLQGDELASKASSQTTKRGSQDFIDVEKGTAAKEEAQDTNGEVDVAGAKAEFASLRRTFSQLSHASKAGTHVSKQLTQIEDENEKDDFDLRDYMVSSCCIVCWKL
jgi:hypothetical protein